MKTLYKLFSLLLVAAPFTVPPAWAQGKTVTLQQYMECISRLNLVEEPQDDVLRELRYLNNDLLPLMRKWARRSGTSLAYEHFEILYSIFEDGLEEGQTPEGLFAAWRLKECAIRYLDDYSYVYE